MGELILPKGYRSDLSVRQTEVAIKGIKDFFERRLAEELNLTRVSAPLFVRPETGLNDNLNGVERPVSFDMKNLDGDLAEVVHSLAKWKRQALNRYGFRPGEGLYTDMNAIRRDEEVDNIHSLYVDQWDWEAVIHKEDRTKQTLLSYVEKIYAVLQETARFVEKNYAITSAALPERIHFITAQELEDRYPDKTSKEREYEAVKEYGAVFLMEIGGSLKSGAPHDGRAPDYDDWSLNGDILLYYPVLDIALELSSMGIRVDEAALSRQLTLAGQEDRARLPFQRAVLSGELPYTIGGGIGQSRICMFFLHKAHIGEVQSSIWPDSMQRACFNNGIELL